MKSYTVLTFICLLFSPLLIQGQHDDTNLIELPLKERLADFSSPIGEPLEIQTIKDLVYADGKFYVLHTNGILVLDQSLNTVDGYQANFRYAENLEVDGNHFYVLEGATKAVQIFTKPDFVLTKSIPSPSPVLVGLSEFMIEHGQLYLHTGNKEKGILTSIDVSDQEKSMAIGSFATDFSIESSKVRNNTQTNQWHIVKSNENLVAVSVGEPLILTYNLQSGELLNSYNLETLPVLEKELLSVKATLTKAQKYGKDTSRTSYTLFTDVAEYEGDLFVLYLYKKNSSKTYQNRVLRITLLENNEFEVKAVYELGDAAYDAISVQKNQLVVSGGLNANELEVYELPLEH